MGQILIPAAAGLAIIASAGIAAAQEHGRQGPGRAPGGAAGMRGPSAARPVDNRVVPGWPSERQGPRAEGSGRVEHRRAEPQRMNRERQQATERPAAQKARTAGQ